MFGSIVEPFLITCALACFFVVLYGIREKKSGKRLSNAIGKGVVFSTVLFIPSCFIVNTAIDPLRYGTFEYEEFDDLGFGVYPRYFPPAARKITAYQMDGGFYAKYSIKKSDLDSWYNDFWNENRDRVDRQKVDIDGLGRVTAFDIDNRFGFLNWEPLPNALLYQGPQIGSGTPFLIYFNETSELAYEFMGYW